MVLYCVSLSLYIIDTCKAYWGGFLLCCAYILDGDTIFNALKTVTNEQGQEQEYKKKNTEEEEQQQQQQQHPRESDGWSCGLNAKQIFDVQRSPMQLSREELKG